MPAGTPALRSRPRFRATGNATYALTPQLTASLQASWVGRTFDSSIPTGATYLSRYLVLDGSVVYAVRNLRFTVATDNLLNRDHEQFIGFPARERRLRLEVAIEI